MLIGYARVSTKDQETHLQMDALHKAGVELIYQVHCRIGSSEKKEKLRAIRRLGSLPNRQLRNYRPART